MNYTVKKLEYDKDFRSLGDSMTVDSGHEFLSATLEKEDGGTYTVTIEAQGYVNVLYKGDSFRCASSMPEELRELFLTGKAGENPDVQVNENNWWEVFVEKDGVLLGSDVMDCDPCDFDGEEDILSFLKDCCDSFE